MISRAIAVTDWPTGLSHRKGAFAHVEIPATKIIKKLSHIYKIEPTVWVGKQFEEKIPVVIKFQQAHPKRNHRHNPLKIEFGYCLH